MKKVILCVFCFISLPRMYAQVINKGDHLFGGSFSFSILNFGSNGTSYSSTGNAGIFPSYGWVIKNDLVFGIRGSINYEHINRTNSPTDKNIRNIFSFGSALFLKKYKLLKNKFGMYINNEIGGNYSIYKEKDTNLPANLKNYSWALDYHLSPGVFYKFSENFFGEGNIGGLFASYYINGNLKNVQVGASFFQYFNLGINYRIAKNK